MVWLHGVGGFLCQHTSILYRVSKKKRPHKNNVDFSAKSLEEKLWTFFNSPSNPDNKNDIFPIP